jgi:hypothetical protein
MEEHAVIIRILKDYVCGDMVVRYVTDEAERVGLMLLPAARADMTAGKNAAVDSLIQIKLVGDAYSDGFSHGLTMRNGESTLALRYQGQSVTEDGGIKTIKTLLKHPVGCMTEHCFVSGGRGVRVVYPRDERRHGSGDARNAVQFLDLRHHAVRRRRRSVYGPAAQDPQCLEHGRPVGIPARRGSSA